VTAPSASRARLGAVHVVVTCANRKTTPVPPQLRLGSMPGCTTAECAREWIARISGPNDTPRLPAEDLYSGEHWMIARQLQAIPAGGGIRLWVCSAGYGLIPAATQIRPYSATFSGQRDRVPGGADGARRWWQALTAWEGPEPGGLRSIRELVAADPSASFLLALSAAYLDACRDDITAAIKELPDPDRLLVISAGARNAGFLAEVMVPADARLQAVLGGTRQALNARIAARLLAGGITSREMATCYLAELLASQPPVPRYERTKLSDEEVTAMIAGRFAQASAMSASRMLREFRDAGYACEQQRFTDLHRQVAGGRR
jgi:hypothetical protein